MRWRVKKLVFRDGSERYLPQSKRLLFWSGYEDKWGTNVSFPSYTEAEEFIIEQELNKLYTKIRKEAYSIDYVIKIPVNLEN